MTERAHILSLPALFDGRAFRVPAYQRGYSWGTRQVDELWTDLQLLDPDSRHFTGMIVARALPGQVVEVIDGQQRLTTLVLLVQAIVRALRRDGGADQARQAEQLEATYLGRPGAYKLGLNEDSCGWFQQLLQRGEPPPTVDNASQRNLREAVRLLRERVDGLSGPGGIQELVETLLSSLRFVYYEVDGDAEAGLIFEVMNNRGKPLSQADRIKNYLMYVARKVAMGPDAAGEVARCFGEVFKQVMRAAPDGAAAAEHEHRLLRTHWVLYHGPETSREERGLSISQRVRQTMLLEPVGPTAVEARDARLARAVLDYAHDLTRTAQHYAEVVHPRAQGALSWVGDGDLASRLAHALLSFPRMGHTAPALALLLAGRARLEGAPERWLRLVEALSAYCLRCFVLCNRRSHTGVALFRRLARWLMETDDLDATFDAILSNVQAQTRSYGSDEEVVAALRSPGFYDEHGSHQIRYLFYERERDLCHGQEPSIDYAGFADSRTTQIEHVRPRSQAGDDFSVDRLGNLTVSHFNQALGARPFDEKRAIYRRSSLLIEHSLQHHERWTAQEVEAREAALVDFVLRRWPLPAAPAEEAAAPAEPKGRLTAFADAIEQWVGPQWKRNPTRRRLGYVAFGPKDGRDGLDYLVEGPTPIWRLSIRVYRPSQASHAAALEAWAQQWPTVGGLPVCYEPPAGGRIGAGNGRVQARLTVEAPADAAASTVQRAFQELVARTHATLWPDLPGPAAPNA